MNEDDDGRMDDSGDAPVYLLDTDTTALIESALNCMITLADAQIDETSKDNLELIADELAARFGINSYKVVETVHTGDDGLEEVIYSPLDGLGLGDETEDPEKDE